MLHRKLLSLRCTKIICLMGIPGKNDLVPALLILFDFLFYLRYNACASLVPSEPSIKSFCISTTISVFIFDSFHSFLQMIILKLFSFIIHIFPNRCITYHKYFMVSRYVKLYESFLSLHNFLPVVRMPVNR